MKVYFYAVRRVNMQLDIASLINPLTQMEGHEYHGFYIWDMILQALTF